MAHAICVGSPFGLRHPAHVIYMEGPAVFLDGGIGLDASRGKIPGTGPFATHSPVKKARQAMCVPFMLLGAGINEHESKPKPLRS